MPLATVYTRAQHGIEAPEVTAEVQLSGGLPGLAIVGLVETSVKESRERVRAAIRQAGYDFPQRKITVNLAPADLPKGGSRFDLAIAVGILAASGQIPMQKLGEYEFFGELAFSGALRGVSALLPALVQARRCRRRCVIPAVCEPEARLVRDAGTLLAGNLLAVARFLSGNQSEDLTRVDYQGEPAPAMADQNCSEDLSDVHGQYQAKRALEIAATGGHNLLMIGSPGTGKTMLARRLPGLLVPLTESDALEVAMIRSLSGIPPHDVCMQRSFRAPHHTASSPALVGGGRPPRPGEISLAHHGVLFLDELPEFNRNSLEALREPLETGCITIARAQETVEFPARFQLVAAMNPCQCGFHGDHAKECYCSADQVRRYQNRISGPFMDRIDIRIELGREDISLETESAGDNESSATVKERVVRARRVQLKRAGLTNSVLTSRQIKQWCWPDPEGRRLLEKAAQRFVMSRRACDRTLRVARTLADLGGAETVHAKHVSEALSLRSFKRLQS